MSFNFTLLFFWNRISYIPGWSWTHGVAEDDLKFLILSSQIPILALWVWATTLSLGMKHRACVFQAVFY